MGQYAKDQFCTTGFILISKLEQKVEQIEGNFVSFSQEVLYLHNPQHKTSLCAKDMHRNREEYIIEDFSKEIYELFQCKEDLKGKSFFDALPDFAGKDEIMDMLETSFLKRDQHCMYLNPGSESIDHRFQFTVLPLFFSKSVKYLLTITVHCEMSADKVLIENFPRNNDYAARMNAYFDKLLRNMTPREREIILQVLEGNTNRCISANLSITEGTVKRTLYNAYQKLGISSRVDLFCMILGK